VNVIQLGKQVREFVSPFLDFVLLYKPFSYTVRLSPQDCMERLGRLSRPKKGSLNASSRTVKIIQEANHSRFEVCIERYGRSLVHNSAKASGIIISTNENLKSTVVQGKLRLGITFLPELGFLLSLVFIFRLDNLSRDLGLYILWLVVGLLFVVRDYRDYRKLEILIHDTFSEIYEVTHGQY
jgi:hypothetical protein